MIGLRLYMLQRLSALVMIPLALGHIAVMIYAVQGGLSADEILARTRGNIAWTLFYGIFVLAVSVHAAIGVRVVIAENSRLKPNTLNVITAIVAIALFLTGANAVNAVTQ